MSTAFLNGKEVKGNETIKEGDCLVCIDNIEGTVYKFQSGISWSGIDTSFKDKVIKAMCELYCQYLKEGRSWIILEISSAYRDKVDQSRVMVEESHLRRKNLVNEYIYKDSMKLLVHLYEHGDLLTHNPVRFHQDQTLIWMQEYQKNPNNYHPSQSAKDQWELYNKVTHSGEKAAFDRYFSFSAYDRIYNNKEAMIEFLILWFQETGYILAHMRNKALDFSSKNAGEQQEKFREILKNMI